MATTTLPPEESLLGQATQKLTLGCPVLDRLLSGGVPVGSVTELVGESTVGKTQLCLQLLLTVQLHPDRGGLAGRAVYIHTEGKAALHRLAELATSTPGLGSDPCDWVLVANATAGPDHLLEAVRQAGVLCASPPEAGQPPVRLLVIDSVAASFKELETGTVGDQAHRANLLYQLAAMLKHMARRHSLCVVVTNHVTDVMDSELGPTASMALEQATGGLALRTSGRRVSPCLGLYWAHCVNTRLFLSRATAPGAASLGPHAIRRSLRVVFAPHLAPGQCGYTITAEGPRGVQDEQDGFVMPGAHAAGGDVQWDG